MKNISNWADLKEYGISCLTGEACAISARALCDLTEEGAANMREFYGLPYNSTFADSWNSGSVASMFIPWDTLPSLSAFLLIKSGCDYAIQLADGIYGIESTDEPDKVKQWLEYNEAVIRRYSPNGGPKRGVSCVHAMSGRSA